MREAMGERSHTEFMLPFIDELMRDHGCEMTVLDAIVFSAGPGSFTGVRLAASVAKSLAYAAAIPVIPVSSLAAIAQTVARVTQSTDPCGVITDARMGEVYAGNYAFGPDGIAFAMMPDTLQNIDRLKAEAFASGRIAGDAAPLLQCNVDFQPFEWIVQSAHAQDLLPLGEAMLKAGKAQTGMAAQAIYLRDKTSWKNIAQQEEERKAR